MLKGGLRGQWPMCAALIRFRPGFGRGSRTKVKHMAYKRPKGRTAAEQEQYQGVAEYYDASQHKRVKRSPTQTWWSTRRRSPSSMAASATQAFDLSKGPGGPRPLPRL